MPEAPEARRDIPAWGMGDLVPPGPPDAPRRGGGSPIRVGFRARPWDAVVVIVALLIWTGLFLFFFAPR